MHVVIWKFC